jgi:hypothetical protein
MNFLQAQLVRGMFGHTKFKPSLFIEVPVRFCLLISTVFRLNFETVSIVCGFSHILFVEFWFITRETLPFRLVPIGMQLCNYLLKEEFEDTISK